MKKIILFALITVCSYSISRAQETEQSTDDIDSLNFFSPEILPEFPGGPNGWMKHLSINLNYPEMAMTLNVSGRVEVSFEVQKNGSLSNIHVTKGIGYGCDEEAVRVVKLSPKWKPGMQNGRPVVVGCVLPVSFVVFNDEEESQPLYVLDGKEISYQDLMDIDSKTLKSAESISQKEAIKKYGKKGQNGVVEVFSEKQ